MFKIFVKIILLSIMSVGAYANHIISYYPEDKSIDLTADTQIRIVYDKAIQPSSIHKQTIILNGKKKGFIKGNTTMEGENTLLFTPFEKLKTTQYSVHVKPIFLQGDKLDKPIGFFSRMMFNTCSFFYKDITKCPLYKHFAKKMYPTIVTRPFSYDFVVNAELPILQTLTLEHNTVEVKETSTGNIDLKATYSDGNETLVKDSIEWLVGDSSIFYIDDKGEYQALKEGTTTLQAKYKNKLSNTINITVYKEINGYRLPPEPDETLNNSTILGIDSNNNGVRDDVERKIYLTYKKAIEQAYMMQGAKRFQKILDNPIVAATSQETQDEMWKQYSCIGYLRRIKNIKVPRTIVEFWENSYMNTKERIKAYIEFNEASSGGVYSIPVHDKDLKKENCDFDVDAVLEMDK
jgi:hypothetical protein